MRAALFLHSFGRIQLKHPKAKPDAERRLRQADRLARVMRVLEMIQSRGRWTIGTIAAELECSERTVYRDLDVLELAGVPFYLEKPGNFIRVREDYRFPVLHLSDADVIDQTASTKLAEAAGIGCQAGAKATLRKFVATHPDKTSIVEDASRMIEVLGLKYVDHSQHRQLLSVAQLALLQSKKLSGIYKSPYETEPTKLWLHPYRLCLIKSAWYLIGRHEEDESPKTYRIARFKSLRLLEQESDIDQDFDIREFLGNAWAVYRGDNRYAVELEFTSDAAPIVTETIWHHTQKTLRNKDGRVVLSFEIDGLNEVVRWIIGWAGKVKVKSPDELRQLVLEKHRQAIEVNDAQD